MIFAGDRLLKICTRKHVMSQACKHFCSIFKTIFWNFIVGVATLEHFIYISHPVRIPFLPIAYRPKSKWWIFMMYDIPNKNINWHSMSSAFFVMANEALSRILELGRTWDSYASGNIYGLLKFSLEILICDTIMFTILC